MLVDLHGLGVLVLLAADREAASLAAIAAGAGECLDKSSLTVDRLSRALRSVLARRDAVTRFAMHHLRPRFLSELCHEIRAPLHVILGMAEVLAETRLDAEQAALAGRIRSAGEHLGALVDDVIDIGRLDTEGFTLERVDFDLHELVTGTLDFMSGAIRGKPVELRHRFGVGVPSIVAGDPRRLRQLLVNLLGNAIKFTERGHVELAVEVASNDGAPSPLRFTIADTGIGIPLERQADVFSSFVQASADVGRTFGGFGLGLHICKRLVERMGGTIGLTSVEGRGSTFAVTVPLLARGAPHSSVRSMLAVHDAPETLAPKRVLLVDDSPDSVLLVRSYVARTEIALDAVESGEAALQRIASTRYDVVLMDMNMPVLDGYATTARVRAWEKERGLSPVPIVALTADALRDSVARSIQVGCNAHVSKPVSKRDLLDAIRRHADPRRPDSSAPSTPEPAIQKLVPRYVDNRRRDVAVMREALVRGDLNVVETLAHNMKGTGRSYGLRVVSDIGRAIEQAVLDDEVDRIEGLLDRLRDALDEVQLAPSSRTGA
jgi:signal transduction histidine kinase/DNA-binding response OmpR family regulator